jgi:transposase-like protein
LPGRAAWKDVAVPKPYPSEFRDDIVRVARNREPGVTIEQIARDFGVHPMTLQKWLQRAAVDDGLKSGQSRAEGAELREARKRIRLLEQENRGLAAGGGVSVAGEPAGKRF